MIANRLIAALCTPYTINDKTIVIGASVGIAVIGKNISEPADVMRHADMALYRAKNEGRNRACIYDIDMDTDLLKRLNTAHDGINGNAAFPTPPVDMATFKSSGFEPVSSDRTRPQDLTQNIRSLDHGANSGDIVVRLKAVPQAISYELQYAADTNGATAPAWTTATVTSVRKPVTINRLTPGTTYAFQVRSLSKSGFSDWADSVTFMCT